MSETDVIQIKVEPCMVGFIDRINHARRDMKSVTEFKFNKKRVRLLSCESSFDEGHAGGIVYWMLRDQRVQDNWALLYAQKLAIKLQIPLTVVYCLEPEFIGNTLRHLKFVLKGLQEVEQELKSKNISFHLLKGFPDEILPSFINDNSIAALVCDFFPLREVKTWKEEILKKISVPFAEVDAHNIIPVWITSEKQEYAARTIRSKITNLLPEYLTHFPDVCYHPVDPKVKVEKID